ncbi:MAG: protein translocase subunit SecD [Chloroflexi bacterium]|nr:protein translocase subunit SecD [Chloroflexota bacterium]
MRRNVLVTFFGIVVLSIFALVTIWPHNPDKYLPFGAGLPQGEGIHLKIGDWELDRGPFKLGLDLVGGTHLLLQADMSKVAKSDQPAALKGVINVIERRINAYGVSEPIVQAQGDDRVIVELPGVKNVEQAISLIGQTAQMDFREQVTGTDGKTQWVVAKAKGSDGQEHELTGQYFKRADVGFEQTTGAPKILFQFNDEGAKLFEQITQRNLYKPIGIYLDNQQLSAPTVQAVISGQGEITGRFTLDEAKNLAIQMNAGALPVPVKVIQQQDVDATLGSDSVARSLIAGEIGLAVVMVFMILYYRLPGVLSSAALGVYSMVAMAEFKMIPVTLTLAGIAGFILSIGMAVDANILIFERMREEMRAGKTLRAAIDAGFDRAWPSIRDSNFSTLITCVILFWFGSNFGTSIVMGFALTLGLGVITSMFSAITVTRTFLRMLVSTGLATGSWFFGLERSAMPAATSAATQETRG